MGAEYLKPQTVREILHRLAVDTSVVIDDGAARMSTATFEERHASLLDESAHFEWTTSTHRPGAIVGVLIVMHTDEDLYFDLVYSGPTVVKPGVPVVVKRSPVEWKLDTKCQRCGWPWTLLGMAGTPVIDIHKTISCPNCGAAHTLDMHHE